MTTPTNKQKKRTAEIQGVSNECVFLANTLITHLFFGTQDVNDVI